MENELFESEDIGYEYGTGSDIVDKGLGGTTPPSGQAGQNIVDRGLGTTPPPQKID